MDITIKDEEYESEVETYILEHNFLMDDLPYVLQNYDKLPLNSQKVIINLIERYTDIILKEEYTMPYTLLYKTMSNDSINYIDRLEILSFSVYNLSDIQCRNCLQELGEERFLSLFDGKRPKIECSTTNERILEAFKEKGWITKYDVEDDVYRVIGRKLKTL